MFLLLLSKLLHRSCNVNINTNCVAQENQRAMAEVGESAVLVKVVMKMSANGLLHQLTGH